MGCVARAIVLGTLRRLVVTAVVVTVFVIARAAFSETIDGQVLAGGTPLAGSDVTMWSAGSGAPQQLGQAQSHGDGQFTLSYDVPSGSQGILYLVARGGHPTAHPSGDNPAIALLAILGARSPAKVSVNEFTTIASVWTNAQFLDGATLRGNPLGIKIAAGNVPSFVDLPSGGWGTTIQDSLNSSQTPTMANFATLADLLSACITQVKPDACSKLFATATDPRGNAPKDTLAAAENIARYPWYRSEQLFALFDEFY